MDAAVFESNGLAKDFPTTAVFSVLEDGLYNLSYGAICRTPDAGAGSTATATMSYTTIAGGNTSQTGNIDLQTTNSNTNTTMTAVWLLAGTAVTIKFIGGAPYGNATYDLYCSCLSN